ncbi:hypothetical protein RUM44_000892 [Polyplax serrata]|uniref:Uncharacterized protein n=1 Tax=Polyplax serrata TaxID=468196 RepID=A0ABR1B8X4_POLSC
MHLMLAKRVGKTFTRRREREGERRAARGGEVERQTYKFYLIIPDGNLFVLIEIWKSEQKKKDKEDEQAEDEGPASVGALSGRSKGFWAIRKNLGMSVPGV